MLLAGMVGVVALGCQERTSEVTAATSVAGLQTAELHVQGTDCASCEVSIRRHLRKLDGVREIRPGSDKEHVFVDFDPVKVSPEQIAKAVLEAGYEAEILVHSMAT
jgi:copper chaperone CopZ